MLPRLPIDDVLPDVLAAIRDRGGCVLIAPPGAGKTTRVPGALLDANLAGGKDIVCLQPRRLAARMAASRVAHERKAELGGEVGYEVRFDRKVSRDTRLRFVTEGVLTRQLLGDPTLRGVGAVLIDEFHERHLAGDLALALLRRLQRGPRPDLRLVVMSATMDPAPVAAYLGDATPVPIVRSEGRMFPVDVRYLDQPDDRPAGKQVAGAVRRLVAEPAGLDGDVLVFLPGTAEIRHATEDCAELAQRHDLLVVPLHGDLAADQQDRAVARAPRPKIILSTNVAETSVTIDGVTTVIDLGTARVARHSPWSGLPSLQIEPISKASAAQRAGRAGRTRPGRALRLYTRHDHDTRRELDAPEIARIDLAEAALELHAAGEPDLAAFPWFEAPAPAALAAADELLRRLGAIDDAGKLTPRGQRMLRFPAHPRQARLIVEAEARGVAVDGCALAALLGARELRVDRRARTDRRGPAQARISAPSDLLEDLDVLRAARHDGMRAGALRELGADVSTAMTVDRSARQLERLCDRSRPEPATDVACDEALQLAILAGYPDRVGRRRAPRSTEIVMSGGGSGTLSPSSVVIDGDLMVVVDAGDTGERGRAKVTIRRASLIDPTWLIELFEDRVADVDELRWNRDRQRVERITKLVYDGLTIDETVDIEGARRDPAAARVLIREALAAGLERFVDADDLAQWRARLVFVAGAAPELGLTAPTDAQLAEVLAEACEGLTSFDELKKASLLSLLDARLASQRGVIDRLAPAHVQLGRRRAKIHYELDRPPWVASRMQDFFGLARGPSVADGRVQLVLHLLAPNQRPVQVTQDLPGFWVRHYPALRKELARRYPRHAWPEDPTALIADAERDKGGK